MAKKPVPKQKRSHARVSRRYKTFRDSAIKKLRNLANLMNCPSCGQKKITHHVCPNCGVYKGRNMVNKEKELKKVTKIKA